MKRLEVMKLKKEDLEKKLFELKKDLFSLKSASLAGEDSQKKKSKIRIVKRDIARIKTRLNNNI